MKVSFFGGGVVTLAEEGSLRRQDDRLAFWEPPVE